MKKITLIAIFCLFSILENAIAQDRFGNPTYKDMQIEVMQAKDEARHEHQTVNTIKGVLLIGLGIYLINKAVGSNIKVSENGCGQFKLAEF